MRAWLLVPTLITFMGSIPGISAVDLVWVAVDWSCCFDACCGTHQGSLTERGTGCQHPGGRVWVGQTLEYGALSYSSMGSGIQKLEGLSKGVTAVREGAGL